MKQASAAASARAARLSDAEVDALIEQARSEAAQTRQDYQLGYPLTPKDQDRLVQVVRQRLAG